MERPIKASTPPPSSWNPTPASRLICHSLLALLPSDRLGLGKEVYGSVRPRSLTASATSSRIDTLASKHRKHMQYHTVSTLLGEGFEFLGFPNASGALAMHSFNSLISATSFLERLRETSILTRRSPLIKLGVLTLQKSMCNRTPFCSPRKRHIQVAS